MTSIARIASLCCSFLVLALLTAQIQAQPLTAQPRERTTLVAGSESSVAATTRGSAFGTDTVQSAAGTPHAHGRKTDVASSGMLESAVFGLPGSTPSAECDVREIIEWGAGDREIIEWGAGDRGSPPRVLSVRTCD